MSIYRCALCENICNADMHGCNEDNWNDTFDNVCDKCSTENSCSICHENTNESLCYCDQSQNYYHDSCALNSVLVKK